MRLIWSKLSSWCLFLLGKDLHLLTNLGAFESSKALRAWKSKLCSQKMSMSRFTPSGKLTKWAKLTFSSFYSFRAFKSLLFCQTRSMSRFPPSGKLTKWAKFDFVDKSCKERSLGELYFPTKTKFFQVLQHFRRKLWCLQMLQKLFSGELYFPAKAKFFQVSQHFRRKMCCPHQYWSI